MKPADRSKLILTAFGGGLLIMAGAIFYSWQPATENAPPVIVKSTPLPVAPPPPPTVAPASKPTPILKPISQTTVELIAKRLTAGIYHQKELISQAQKENQLPHENPTRKQTMLNEITQKQEYECDRSRRTLLLMKSLPPAAQQAVATAVDQMNQASGLLRKSSVQDAVDHGQSAIRQMQTALSLISQPEPNR